MNKFTGDYYGIREMLNSPQMVSEMGHRAERIRQYAESIAPVYRGPDDPHRGRYKASFHDDSYPFGGTHPPHARAEGKVWNDAPEAADVEWGVIGHGFEEGHHTLLRALHDTRGGEL